VSSDLPLQPAASAPRHRTLRTSHHPLLRRPRSPRPSGTPRHPWGFDPRVLRSGCVIHSASDIPVGYHHGRSRGMSLARTTPRQACVADIQGAAPIVPSNTVNWPNTELTLKQSRPTFWCPSAHEARRTPSSKHDCPDPLRSRPGASTTPPRLHVARVHPCPGIAHRGHRFRQRGHGAASAPLRPFLHRARPQKSLDYWRHRPPNGDLSHPAGKERSR